MTSRRASRPTTFGGRVRVVADSAARPAEFNKRHVAAFVSDEESKAHICVYSFLRSYDWMPAFEADEPHRIVVLMRHLRPPTAFGTP